jgi:hypothetical protein
MESAGSRKGKRRSKTHDSDSSTDGSSSQLSSSSGSGSSSPAPAKRSSASPSASANWSPAKPQMVVVDGKEHFRGKTTNNLIGCSRPPTTKCKYVRHITGFGTAPNLAVWVPSGNDGPGGGVRGQRNSSMPATELSRPTARTSVPRMLPPPLQGLEKSRPSATSTSRGSSGGDSHGTQEFHCDGDWKIYCSGRSSRGTRTATARSCSQGSGCSRSSPGFPMSSGRPIGCSLKLSNTSLSKRPLVAPKNGPQCSALASFAAPPARRKTGKSWPSLLSQSCSVSGYQKQSQQRRMDKSSTSRA